MPRANNGTEEPPRLFELDALIPLTIGEQIDVVARTHGFIPDSSDELSGVLSASAVENGPRGAAKHLGEIYGHQETRTAGSGFNAARAVTHRYISYHRSAMSQHAHLSDLLEDLKVSNMDILLSEAIPLKRTSVGILANFVRHSQLLEQSRTTSRTFAAEDLDVNLSVRQDRPENRNEISELLSRMTVKEARKFAEDAISNQAARRRFWYIKLDEIKLFTPVKTLVEKAIK